MNWAILSSRRNTKAYRAPQPYPTQEQAVGVCSTMFGDDYGFILYHVLNEWHLEQTTSHSAISAHNFFVSPMSIATLVFFSAI